MPLKFPLSDIICLFNSSMASSFSSRTLECLSMSSRVSATCFCFSKAWFLAASSSSESSLTRRLSFSISRDFDASSVRF